jgi:hypothetical protein
MGNPNNKKCVVCGKDIVHPNRKLLICLDCLIVRISEVLPPTKRKKFMDGLTAPEKAQAAPLSGL